MFIFILLITLKINQNNAKDKFSPAVNLTSTELEHTIVTALG
ncbi:hypothetical protein X564_07660 [Pseudoalteromonas agarivorans]|nr:hypothetical protein X564_07660 [Pseudoalteromonas agarivorans]